MKNFYKRNLIILMVFAVSSIGHAESNEGNGYSCEISRWKIQRLPNSVATKIDGHMANFLLLAETPSLNKWVHLRTSLLQEKILKAQKEINDALYLGFPLSWFMGVQKPLNEITQVNQRHEFSKAIQIVESCRDLLHEQHPAWNQE